MIKNHLFQQDDSMTSGSGLPRILPFATFMAFIGFEEIIRWMSGLGYFVVTNQQLLFLYPVKILATGSVLVYFRNKYTEINWRDLAGISVFSQSLFAGLLVLLLWINMDWGWATFGSLKGFDPTAISASNTRLFIISSRLIGASILVPFMEELFWRSWLLRYLINDDIAKVPIGTFSWISFSIGTVLFGLEHNLWLAGMMAGAVYSLLLYRTKSIAACVLAHAVTNGLLGGYVLWSKQWSFW
jgi:CAAX prenyl protease-like protein